MFTDYKLINAIQQNCYSDALDALQQGASPDAEDDDGKSVLQLCERYAANDIALELIKRKATINQSVGRQKDSLMHVAARKGNFGFAQLLLAHGHPVNTRNARGETPLLLAVQKGHAYLADSLLQHGAEVNALSGKGHSARFIATQNNDSDVLRVLDKYGAHQDTFKFAEPEPATKLQSVHSVRPKIATGLERE